MTEAIFGLIGVIVGGLLTTGGQWASARREERRQERLAARILYDELTWWRSGLEWAMKLDDLGALDPPGSVMAAWEANRAALVGLSSAQWHILHGAVRSSNADSYGLTKVAIPTSLAEQFRVQCDRIEKGAVIMYAVAEGKNAERALQLLEGQLEAKKEAPPTEADGAL